jgi:sporulation protein YlmC with PRC-barrel domain
MRMSLKQLKSLGVETISGVKLGHVVDVILEIDGQLVAQYEVKSSFLNNKSYLVSRDQVVRFEAEKMVVDDNIVIAGGKVKEGKREVRPEPVAMRE